MILKDFMQSESVSQKKRIAFYGGSFDPIHNGHLTVARKLVELFRLDEFYFVPAFHAPHKKKPTSAFHRYTMLCLATANNEKIKVSRIEVELPERPYTIETLTKLKSDLPDSQIFFVMGADSWQDITTWREWEKVLTLTNHIVVTRPPIEISFSHISSAIAEKISDLRGKMNFDLFDENRIYITNAVSLEISATEIRQKIREKSTDWNIDLPHEVAAYIQKYKIYG
jgi:nicotinate-nucleotide adenylyltransferase